MQYKHSTCGISGCGSASSWSEAEVMDIYPSQQLYRACFSQVNAELPSNCAQSYVLLVRKYISHSDGLMPGRIMLLMFLELIACVFLGVATNSVFCQDAVGSGEQVVFCLAQNQTKKTRLEDQYKTEFAASVSLQSPCLANLFFKSLWNVHVPGLTCAFY